MRRRRLLLLLALLIVALLLAAAYGRAPLPLPPGQPQRVQAVDLLGVISLAPRMTFEGTPVGGLSGITYDPWRDRYYVVSDDTNGRTPSRYYTLQIDLADGSLDEGDLHLEEVTLLCAANGEPYRPGVIDAEAIAQAGRDTLYIAAERDHGRYPSVKRHALQGCEQAALPLPPAYLPRLLAHRSGVRTNRAFESLTLTPDGRYLVTGTEVALVQDGPLPGPASNSPARLLYFDLANQAPAAQYVYAVSSYPETPPVPAFLAGNGLVDIQALDAQGRFLAMERFYALGAGHTVRIYETSVLGATDVAGSDVLDVFTPMSKALVVDLQAGLGIAPANVEGMAFGPLLPDGRQSLILVSDNNFFPSQATQFIALALTLAPAD